MSDLIIPSPTIYIKPTELEITTRKLEQYQKYAEIKQWGLRNPTAFIEEFIGVTLLDQQKYVIASSWDKPFCLWLESRGAGKSTCLALYYMAKTLLIENYRAYICSGTAAQSIETFTKIEDIAKKRIASMAGLTDVFKTEVAVNNNSATGDGWLHNPMGYSFTLYNNSSVKTLNSNIDKQRGKRANSVCFDEGSWLSEETFNVIGAYTTVNSEFKIGGDFNVHTKPDGIPNQLLYASSASALDTAFYKKYRDFSKKMMLGDDRYFVCDINCDVVIRATLGGKVYPVPLLNKETVEAEMRNNPEKASREYYNRFTDSGGMNQIIKRAEIVRNSYIRPPVLGVPEGVKKSIVMAYDSARNTDCSVVGIAELTYDEERGYTMDIINCVSFVDLALKRKTPMMYQEQIKELRQLLLDYNGGFDDYDNLEILMVDAGAGGGGNSWVRDSLVEDWEDKAGKKHPGLIDKEYSSEYVGRFPNAINKLKMIEPVKYKSEMFEALIRMVQANLITFPAEYDNKGYLNILEVDNKTLNKKKAEIISELDKQNLSQSEYEMRLEEELSNIDVSKSKIYKLTLDEEVALKQIDAMKEEITSICRTKRESGRDMFKLPPHKDAGTGGYLHDDKAYVLSMLGWALQEKRLEHIRTRKKPNTQSIIDMLTVTPGKPLNKLFG